MLTATGRAPVSIPTPPLPSTSASWALERDPALLESKDKDGETPLIDLVGVPDENTQAATATLLIDRRTNINASTQETL